MASGGASNVMKLGYTWCQLVKLFSADVTLKIDVSSESLLSLFGFAKCCHTTLYKKNVSARDGGHVKNYVISPAV